MMMKPIADQAEVSIDFPDKAYVGAFTRNSGFDAHADAEGVSLKLSRPGEDRRTAEVHLHYYLFADILEELAMALAARPRLDEAHRAPLLKAARDLQRSLAARRPRPSGE
jgi:hypothetical protein